MRHRTLVLAAALLAMTAAGCNRKPAEQAQAPAAPAAPLPAPVVPAAPPLTVADGYRHQTGVDASGYYLSPVSFEVGNYRLAHLALGAPSDFQAWEKGDHSSTFGPILLQFDDVTSPRVSNETGGEGHTVQLRVLPQAYNFDAGKVTFRGHAPKLGEVIFIGSFDQAALTQARVDGSSQSAVLSGDLKIGTHPARKVSFTYWAGD
jgi:hypothetical protein